MRKNINSGFIHIIPLLFLAIAILTISFVDFSNINFGVNKNASVLSETDEENNEEKNEEDGEKKREETRNETQTQSGKDEDDGEEVQERERDEERESEDEDEDEDEVENEDETDDEEELEVESENGTKVKIKVKANGNEFEFESEGSNVKSNFPLSVNPETNELVVTTPNGQKSVTILPNEAVTNMIENKKITTVLSTSINEGEGGELEYQVEGEDQEKLFGVFNIKIHKRYTISAQNGEETSSDIDLFNRLLDLLSF